MAIEMRKPMINIEKTLLINWLTIKFGATMGYLILNQTKNP